MIGTPTNTSPATPHASDKSTNQCASDKSTAQHASVKPTSTPQASGRKSPGKSEKSIGKGEHSGTGSTSKKRKRKKSSGTVAPAIPSHPSVIEAGAYTKRQEQVEEARAREAVYLIPREEMTVGEKGDTTSNAGSYVGTPGTEIVAFKREETRSTLSNARSSAGTQRTETAGSNLGESGNTAPGAGSCASDSVIAGSASRASQVEESRDAAASHTRPSAGDSAVAGSVTRASKGEETRDTAAPNSRSSSGETALKTGLSAGDSGLAGSVSRARRPWETQIIVSTTVIEVGVDVPNATVMVIENAERFGLSQLHQLRGRVGRGKHKSFCFLMSGSKSPDAKQRLGVLEQSQDGFFIAEMDMRFRGPGAVLGTRQSGLPDFALANLVEDQEILSLARDAAEKLISVEPSLARFPNLQQELNHRYQKLLGGSILN